MKSTFILILVFSAAIAVNAKREHKRKEEIKSEVKRHFGKLGDRFEEIEQKLDKLTEKNQKNVAGNNKTVVTIPHKPKPDAPIREHMTEEELNSILGVADNFYEGDILLTPEQIDVIAAEDEKQTGEHNRNKRKVVKQHSKKWPSTKISYTFDSTLDQEKIVQIRAALKVWESNTCLTFTEGTGTTSTNYLEFFNGTGCYSNLGFLGGKQGISIGDGCRKLGIIAHEIGHALGFVHEQSRYDRDNYVTVNYGQINSNNHAQYKPGRSFAQILYADYDYGSIMHYGIRHFAISDQPTMTAKDKNYQETIGNRISLTFLDIFTMNEHYCKDVCRNGAICQNGGYPNPNSCSSCICPSGFGGDDCSSSDSGQGCGGDKLAEPQWQTMNVNVEKSEQTCFWHIKAPDDKFKIQIKLSKLVATCEVGCYNGMVELKPIHDFIFTGYRQCCYESANINKTLTGTNLVPIIAFARKEVFFQLQYRYVNHDETEVLTSVVAEPPPRGCYDVNTGKICDRFVNSNETKERHCFKGAVLNGACKPAAEFVNPFACTVEEICRKSCGDCKVDVTEAPVASTEPYTAPPMIPSTVPSTIPPREPYTAPPMIPSTVPSTIPSTVPVTFPYESTPPKELCYDVNTMGICGVPRIKEWCLTSYGLPERACLPPEEYPKAHWKHGCTIKDICRKSCGEC